MKKIWINSLIALILVLASVSIYYIQFLVFHDPKDTFFYLFQDLAFVPLQVFIVTIIIERILTAREKREILRKINVVISAFFSEVGTTAIEHLSKYAVNTGSFKELVGVSPDWGDENFKSAVKGINAFEFEMYSENGDLNLLKAFLMEKKPFMLTMFENTNLLEHDTFTDMLWAVFHVADELESRASLLSLPAHDLEHLSGDIKRAYKLLLVEWIYYMNHLKKEYPYLFSLAIRKSPFNESRSVIIR